MRHSDEPVPHSAVGGMGIDHRFPVCTLVAGPHSCRSLYLKKMDAETKRQISTEDQLMKKANFELSLHYALQHKRTEWDHVLEKAPTHMLVLGDLLRSVNADSPQGSGVSGAGRGWRLGLWQVQSCFFGGLGPWLRTGGSETETAAAQAPLLVVMCFVQTKVGLEFWPF